LLHGPRPCKPTNLLWLLLLQLLWQTKLLCCTIRLLLQRWQGRQLVWLL
jgi:hypothetical protein